MRKKRWFGMLAGVMVAGGVHAQQRIDPAPLPDPEIKVAAPSGGETRIVKEVMGDWVIRSDKVSTNTLFKVHGNIFIMPGATWAMTDCEVVVMCEYARQYRMYWEAGGTLKTVRCRLGGFDDGTRFAPTNFEVKGGTWIATDTEVHTCYAVSVGDGTVFRGNRFVAGEHPDSIIVSGNADVVLKDSRFPISISMHCMKGGEVELDLPVDEPMTQVLDAKTFLNAGGQYRIVFENTVVPHWFIFARDIDSNPDFPKATITIKHCPNFLLSILTKNVTGEVVLPVDLEHPIQVGNTTIRRADGVGTDEVHMRMYGGIYFGGKPDAVVRGPEVLPEGSGPVRPAETMIWGGKVLVDGGPNKTILLNCTTMDVWNGELTVENLQLGRPNGVSQIIVEKSGKLVSRNCDFGKHLYVLTKDKGTADFYSYLPGERIRVKTDGGDVNFHAPRAE